MSERLISRSPDLLRLREEGYEIEIVDNHLVIRHVPYVTPEREVRYGSLVSTLTLSGDQTQRPDTHVVTFAGEIPCDQHGAPLHRIIIGSDQTQLSGQLSINHTFSSKPPEGYPDYYEKMSAYVAMVSGPAHAIDQSATPLTHRVIASAEDSVFVYSENSSSRAGIAQATAKLEIPAIAIVGLGGTGSYVLDFLAKVPIAQIHLWDGDDFLQHNAFRSPGAPSLETLQAVPRKAAYFGEAYSAMRRGIVVHDEFLDEGNVSELQSMDFVFICIDDGPTRKLLVDRLTSWEIDFIDVGMGIYEADGVLGGLVRTTTSAPGQRDHVYERNRVPFSTADDDNAYRQNIQIAELNALNAAFAVIRWKKLAGFYADFDQEHHSLYQLDGNLMVNEARPESDE